jgi:rSAM/selenodomain-associated transferase 2
MLHAFARSFAEGFDRVVLVGSDCPRVDERVLDRAFESLSAGPAAIGPASDGGYYLIGLRRPAPQLFDSVAWGTDGVLAQTLQRARYAALDVALLDELDDVDRPEDMPVWNAAAAAEGDLTASSVSVVMPALNEERRIQASLDSVARARAAEVIVVDGGSEDRTVEIARAAGARVISCRPGRALQANAGAAAASGRILLFVHADTLLPWGYDDAARHAMADPRNVAGAFRLRLEADGAPFRLIETNINARSRVLSTPYGDQGLFVRADTFGVLGGFKPMAVMEDFEMVHRLRRLGRICVLNTPATTSARRWQQLGPLRVTVINQVMIAGYALGIQPNRLAALYGERAGRRARKKQ